MQLVITGILFSVKNLSFTDEKSEMHVYEGIWLYPQGDIY